MSFKETEVGRIPQEWELYELKDKANITMGQSPRSEFYNNNREGIPFMQGRTTFGDKYHTIDTWCTDPKKYAKQNDVLISVRAPVGDVNIAITDLCIGRGLASLSMENRNNEFLYYLLKNYTNLIMSKVSGTVFSSINKVSIETLRLPFPSDEEQKDIAKILSDLDNKIELNKKINKRLEDMAQTIFKHWFVDFEFPNEEGKPYKSSGGEMIESELGMIPKGWEVKELGDISRVGSGKRPKKKSKEKNEEYIIPLIGASSPMGYVNDVLYNEKILVIGRVGTHGVVQRIYEESWPSDNTLIIIPKYYEYVYQILNLIDYKSLNVGSTQPLITQTDIKSIQVVLPYSSQINKFEEIVGILFSKVMKNNIENEKLSNLRDTLLPKLMSGEIRVPID